MSSQPEILPLVAQRATHLRRGINLSHWFSQVYHAIGYSPKHFDSYITGEDIALIRTMGFDHIRFPINAEPILYPADPSRLPSSYMARLDRAVKTMLDQGLAIIIDIHPETPLKKQLATSDEKAKAFVVFWEAFAGHFARFDANRIFFEVLNEPEIGDPKRWNQIQNQAAAAIRRAAPEHTIICGGDEWSALPMLELLELPEDRNIICNFHLYDPIVFTHQGAKWAPPYAVFCKGMTYPSDPAFIADFLKNVRDPKAVQEITEYRNLNWSPARYEAMIGRAVDWTRARGRALTCNEFGVYKVFAPRASRLQWLKDISAILEKHRIGWTMWDYAGDFEVVNTKEGKRMPDHGVLAALGLQQ
jgi:aryl-phospho-beta-D-glucosidase BglC (GH1 family)